MKRIVWMMVLAFSFGLCLTACKGGGENVVHSHVFQGAVSAESYASAEAAVKAFLEREVSGSDMQAEYVSYKKEAELTQEEIEKLPLGDYAEGLQSAERGTVEYTATYEYPSSKETETVKRSVCILSYTDTFRYFVPPVAEGETLTRASFSYLLPSEEMEWNCTMELTLTEKVNGKVVSQCSYLDKIAKDYAFHYGKGVSDDRPNGGVEEWYVIQTNEEVADAYREGEPDDLGEFDMTFGELTKEESPVNYFCGDCAKLLEGLFPIGYGHTWFIKTDTGFSVNPIRVSHYLADPEQYSSGAYYNKITALNEFSVHISDEKIDLTVMLKGVDREGTATTEQWECKFYDFGKTEVDVPAEVMALLPAEWKDSN